MNTITRRDLLSGTAAGLGTTALLDPAELQAKAPAPTSSAATGIPVNSVLNVNGRDFRVSHDVRASLLDTLREHLALAGTKKGCDHGQCGACTVHIDGRTALSCL